MNHGLIIKVTNRVALYATTALVFWVITFLTITVFGLKIFREHMTGTFYLSILGIFAILGGAIVLNVMSNLSKISEAIAQKESGSASDPRISKAKIYIAVASVPVVITLLFVGNELSALKKKDLLVSAAEAMVSENQKELRTLAAYEFGSAYIEEAAKILSVMRRIDENVPIAQVILPDTIGDKRVFLAFQSYPSDLSKKAAEKVDFIYSSSKEERAYLESVFSKGSMEMRFLASGGNYELYLPVKVEDKLIVLYFSDFQRYGKYGS